MAFASEFEYEDELEEPELLDLEYEDWKTQDWVEFHRFGDMGLFEGRRAMLITRASG